MIKLITRCDDAGSSRSANLAIARVMKAGLVRNVSLMAPCAYIEEFAAASKDARGVTFGMHATLNAEWDKVKWKPLTRASERLTDADGYFLPDPRMFLKTKPTVSEIIAEYEAQYWKLSSLGFNARYIDSHMLPELFVPGLLDATDEFSKRFNLINHVYYYDLPGADFMKHPKRYDGRQLFIVAHPSLDTPETRLTGNQSVSGAKVAKARARETRTLSSPLTRWFFRRNGIEPVSYEQAVPGGDAFIRGKVEYEGPR
ncbi:MAG: ChbG/HpnK family deacetylase [Oscillospiraceae bacterium]|jgi:hypothetical protein|nr:ChbG/HpnK family deacetylase [Oscillospiraceae bacterium]